MKPGIMNLNKWAERTAQAVRAICGKKQAPCVGFSLVFFDPVAPDEHKWNFVIELAFDPHNPPSDEEKENLEKTFEFISEGIKRIMNADEIEDNLEDYIVHGSFH